MIEERKDRGKNFDEIFQEYYNVEKKEQRRIEKQRKDRTELIQKDAGL